MRQILFLLVIVVFLIGCASFGPQKNFYYDKQGSLVEITDPQGQCVLYRVVGENTQLYGKSLFVANYAAIKAGIYSADEALAELTTIESSITSPGATVGSVINTLFIVATKASKIGAPEIILITQGLDGFKGDMTPLDDCTRYKLLDYIGGQRLLCIAFQK